MAVNRLGAVVIGVALALFVYNTFHLSRRKPWIGVTGDAAASSSRPALSRLSIVAAEAEWASTKASTTLLPTATPTAPRKEATFASSPDCSAASLRPRRHIVYLKVQKTASTTVRTMLQMFALKHNMQMCMDSIDIFHMGWPSPFINELVVKPHGRKCDLLAEEMIYNRRIIERITHKDSVYVASVADPIKHFMSMFNFNLITVIISKAMGRTLTRYEAVRIYLAHPHLVRDLFNSLNETEKSSGHQLVLQMRNLQLHDFGITRAAELPSEELKSRIETILSEFHFIIVANHFDESMVLLRRVLCCSLDDLMYVKLNSAQSSKQRRQPIPDDIRKSIALYNNGDVQLFNAVNQTFWTMVRRHAGFKAELKLYREKLKEHARLCDNTNEVGRPKECFPLSIETFWADLQKRLKNETARELLLQARNKRKIIL